MTNGFGAMQDYAAQVPVADRWAIAAYIRALQLSQRATVNDVPADRRAELDRPEAQRTVTADAADCLRPSPADLDALRSHALIAGGRRPRCCARSAFVVDRDHFFRSWLIAYLLFLGIALGSMALVMIQHLSGGAWGVFRRIFEASSRTLPLLALLFLPVVLGMGIALRRGRTPSTSQADEILRHKAPYLNIAVLPGARGVLLRRAGSCSRGR